MKRFLKIVGLLLLLLVLGGIIYGWTKHEPLPEGVAGKEADVLAQKMLTALNQNAFENTQVLEWSFRNGKNHYKWNKELGICEVKWDDVQINLNLSRLQKSKVLRAGESLSESKSKKLIEKALGFFNNDSFWLVAPYKVFDNGTQRKVVTLDDRGKALLITYTAGGSTPGDSYLWLLNENGFPNSYKMWTSVIPIGGVAATWDDWLVTESGAFLPKSHEMGPITFSMGDVKGYNE